MANEERQILSLSRSNNRGSGKSRNSKQKKVPQRGLGVAQLEKIIVEEQKKREAVPEASRFLGDSAALQCPNPSNLPDQEIGLQVQPASSANWPALYNGVEEEKQRPERAGHTFVLPYDQSHQIQRPSFSMVNPPPSLFSSQMEPPSNQILHGIQHTFQWLEPDHNQMVGMKRPCPHPSNYPPAYKSRLIDCCFRDGRDTGPGEFLTLAPPAAPSSSKQKKKLLMNDAKPPIPDQENQWTNRVAEQQLEFFPLKPQFGQTASGNGEQGETMDLTLKL